MRRVADPPGTPVRGFRFGRVAGFKSEPWPASFRNGGRHQIGMPGRNASEFAESDFQRPCIIGYGSSPPRCGPVHFAGTGRTWDLPVPAQGAFAHARFCDHAGLSRRSR